MQRKNLQKIRFKFKNRLTKGGLSVNSIKVLFKNTNSNKYHLQCKGFFSKYNIKNLQKNWDKIKRNNLQAVYQVKNMKWENRIWNDSS